MDHKRQTMYQDIRRFSDRLKRGNQKLSRIRGYQKLKTLVGGPVTTDALWALGTVVVVIIVGVLFGLGVLYLLR